MLNTITQIFLYAFLLSASSYFGYAGKPAEMGLSILASVLALAFSNIDKFKKFKAGGFEAEMREKVVEAMVAKEAEPLPSSQSLDFTGKAFGFDENKRKIIMALGNSKYTWRSISGITQESGVAPSEARTALGWLRENGLAIAIDVSSRVTWGLTEEGRDVFNAIGVSPSPDAA